MNRNTPDPKLTERWCQTCHGRTAFLYTFEGKRRCRECLLDCLLHGARGARRQRLLRLLDGPDWAQGELDYGD